MRASGPSMENAVLMPPHMVYQERLEEHRERRSRHENLESLLGNARLVVFLAGLLAAWMAFGAHWLSPWWVAFPGIAFLILLPIHDRLNPSISHAHRAMAF